MIDRFLSKLYEKLSDATAPAIQIANNFDDHSEMAYDKFVNLTIFKNIIERIKIELVEEQIREESKRPYKKFMFVEDGSVDADELVLEMERTNPEIRVIVYRQGANRPELLDIKE